MATAMGVEDLLAIERELHRTLRAQREETRRELVRERIALPAERPAVGRRDHPDAGPRDTEHLLQLTVQVVGHLRRRPHVQPALAVVMPDRDDRLGKRVGHASELEPAPRQPDGGE